MSYIKQISIKSNPKKTLEYILNVNKATGELISGINIIPDVEFANNHFSMVFNQYYNKCREISNNLCQKYSIRNSIAEKTV